eukprot:762485-Hanusia_phi.AAC.1
MEEASEGRLPAEHAAEHAIRPSRPQARRLEKYTRSLSFPLLVEVEEQVSQLLRMLQIFLDRHVNTTNSQELQQTLSKNRNQLKPAPMKYNSCSSRSTCACRGSSDQTYPSMHRQGQGADGTHSKKQQAPGDSLLYIQLKKYLSSRSKIRSICDLDISRRINFHA